VAGGHGGGRKGGLKNEREGEAKHLQQGCVQFTSKHLS